MSLALQQVHAIESKSFYLDESLGAALDQMGFGGGIVDEEGVCGAFSSLDVWKFHYSLIGDAYVSDVFRGGACSHQRLSF